MGSRTNDTGHPDQTGDAVFVDRIEDLAPYKVDDAEHGSGGVFVISFPLVFTHKGVMDFLNCRFETVEGGTISGYSPFVQKIAASTLGAVPFITSRWPVHLVRFSVMGVDIVFDLDGIAAPGANTHLLEVGLTECADIGVVVNYAQFLVETSTWSGCGELLMSGLGFVGFRSVLLFEMNGGLVLSGAMGGAAFQTGLFSPLDGVTAVRTTSSPLTTIGTTIDLVRMVFALDFAGSVGIDIRLDTTFPAAESYNMQRVLFQTTAGGAPVGVPIPPGARDATSNDALFLLCRGTANSATISVITVTENTLATVIAAPDTAVRVALDNATSRKESKLINSVAGPTIGRTTFDGGIDTTLRVVVVLSVTAGNNKVVTFYIAVGDAATPTPVPVAIVPYTAVSVTTNAGGKADAATVKHIDVFMAGDGGFIELWGATADGSNFIVTDMHLDVTKLPA